MASYNTKIKHTDTSVVTACSKLLVKAHGLLFPWHSCMSLVWYSGLNYLCFLVVLILDAINLLEQVADAINLHDGISRRRAYVHWTGGGQ